MLYTTVAGSRLGTGSRATRARTLPRQPAHGPRRARSVWPPGGRNHRVNQTPTKTSLRSTWQGTHPNVANMKEAGASGLRFPPGCGLLRQCAGRGSAQVWGWRCPRDPAPRSAGPVPDAPVSPPPRTCVCFRGPRGRGPAALSRPPC